MTIEKKDITLSMLTKALVVLVASTGFAGAQYASPAPRSNAQLAWFEAPGCGAVPNHVTVVTIVEVSYFSLLFLQRRNIFLPSFINLPSTSQ